MRLRGGEVGTKISILLESVQGVMYSRYVYRLGARPQPSPNDGDVE